VCALRMRSPWKVTSRYNETPFPFQRSLPFGVAQTGPARRDALGLSEAVQAKDVLITEGYHSGGGRKFRGKVRHKCRCS
jgi:hypothetical protein